MASLGQSLREEREGRGISLEEIAAATKIVPRYLEALETDRLDLMPRGFFIKGIIRAYAKAVGLDPEEILGRYREAGLLGPSGHERFTGPRPAAAPPALPHAEPAPPTPRRAVPEAAVPADKPPAEPEPPVPALIFEEASKPARSPETRRKVLAWVWRGLAGLLIVGVGLVLWAPWRPHAAGPRPEAVAVPPALEPVPPPSQTVLPPAPDVWKGITIEIVFEAETWIQVYTDGTLQIAGTFQPGATARAEAAEKLLIHTGNAGGFTFKLNGRQAKPLGRSGQVLTDIKITAENLKEFLEDPTTGRPAG